MKQAASAFWDWIDKRFIIRRILVLVVLWLTIQTILWAMNFSETCVDRTGTDIAAIIAAILTPLSVLQGMVFKFYLESK